MSIEAFGNFIVISLILAHECQPCSSYNILVTTVSGAASQNLVMYRLADLLGQRGHNVTILKVVVFEDIKTPKVQFVKEEIGYKVIENETLKEEIRLQLQDNSWNSTSGGFKLPILIKFFGQLSNGCKNFIADEDSAAFQKLKSQKFDVFIVHLMDSCSIGLAHRLNVKGTIWMSTAFTLDFMAWYAGAPTPVSYVSTTFSPMSSTDFLDRLLNGLNLIAINAIFQYGIVRPYTNIFRERYGSDFPSFDELFHKVQLQFINSDPFFEYPRPILHKMIYVGSLTMENPEPLDEKWKKIVDNSSPNGIVIVSFGSVTNASYMPMDWKVAFVNAFKRLEQTVIWKLEGDTSIVKGVPNVVTADWLPQRDLMAHPMIKALVTHGGYNSLTEATYMGIPLVMLPLYEIIITMNRDNISAQSIYDALSTVINNKTIQSNAKHLGRMIRKKPHSSKQTAIEWVEFLAEFQDLDQLSPKGQQLNLIEYFMIDIFICLGLIILVIWTVFIYVLFKICAKLFRCQKSKIE